MSALDITLMTVLFVIVGSAILLLAGVKAPETASPKTAQPLRRAATWTVGCAPIGGCVGLVLISAFTSDDSLALLGLNLTPLAVLIGFIGGMILASNRKNPWWLLVSLVSAGIVLPVIVAIAQLPPVNIY